MSPILGDEDGLRECEACVQEWRCRAVRAGFTSIAAHVKSLSKEAGKERSTCALSEISAERSDLLERSCAAYLRLRCVVEASPAPLIKVDAHRTHLRHANEHHTIRASGWARNVQGRARKVGDEAARWHGTTRSRSSVALLMAGQRGVALDQWFQATTHTFNSKSVSAATRRSAALLGGPHWPPKRNLRNELSDLVSGRCETRLHKVVRIICSDSRS